MGSVDRYLEGESQGHVDLGISLDEIQPRSDLTYRVAENLEVVGASLHRSLLTGSLLRNCTFRAVEFSRCDLDGLQVENCLFIECDFDGAELRASTFSNCRFDQSSLANTHILDSSFLNCEFVSTPFTNSNISQTTFRSGALVDTSLDKTSCTLNRFKDVRFERMILGNCTFLYAVMDGCTFHDVTMSAECIGMIYGLKRSDLERFKFIYLGDDQEVPPEGDRVRLLVDLYRERRWLLGMLILNLNFSVTSTVYAIREYAHAFFGQIRKGRLIKTDELEFFSQVLRELRAEEKLPFFNIVEIVETTSTLLPDITGFGEKDARTQNALTRFSSTAFLILNDMLEEFEHRRIRLSAHGSDSALQLTAVFHEAPELSFEEFLNVLAAQSEFPVSVPTKRISARHGSYIEVVATTLFTALAFQVFLFLVKGCVVQVTELKHRLTVLAGDRTPTYYRQTAMQSAQHVPEILTKPMQNLMSYASALPWLGDPQMKHIGPPNLQSLELRTLDDPEAMPRRADSYPFA